MIKRLLWRVAVYGLVGCLAGLVLAEAVAQPLHPRGMVTAIELQAIREKVRQSKWTITLQQLEKDPDLWAKPAPPVRPDDAYRLERWMSRCAFLYGITGKLDYARQAARIAEVVLRDTLVYLNPMSKGLTRAAVFRSLATAYDLCYDQWAEPLREQVSRSLFETAFSMQSTMGMGANYALESNWMGVRYASVLYGLMVSDYKGRQNGKVSEANLLEWDVRERLRDHISANMNPNGWSGESLGYHYYSWSFIAPALMAYEHNVIGRGKALAMLAPTCINAVATHAAMVGIVRGTEQYNAVKPDFSDDNIGVRPEFFLQALRLYPKEQLPYIQWITEKVGYPHTEEALFYALAWQQDAVQAQNPALAGWRQAVEPAQGAIALRNRFQDSTDIIAAFTTTAKRLRAHQSGDNLSFRIIGLDNIWVVGAGRTGLKAGQPTLFPADTISLTESFVRGAIGKLLHYGLDSNGGGFAAGLGSCMGVEQHYRYFRTDFDPLAGAAAVFIVHDTSLNGRTWRLTTPEWNEVKITQSGFVLVAPNGATLQVTLLSAYNPVAVRVSRVKYNGTTTENASGIPYKGKRWSDIKAVDLLIDRTATVVMTLQPAGQAAPAVRRLDEQRISVGKKEYAINTNK